ncbi:hypothetical protein HY991_04115 [Candidatus Micrarchaeota archaeon]|nr:hypothetical protein [Candidatus Micrarchaeota archaeon]
MIKRVISGNETAKETARKYLLISKFIQLFNVGDGGIFEYSIGDWIEAQGRLGIEIVKKFDD